MKKQLTIAAGVIILALVIFFSCKRNKTEIDLVNGIEPVHQWDPVHQGTLEALKDIPDDQKITYLTTHWPTLKSDIEYWLKRENYIPQDQKIDSIPLFYGSGKGKSNDKNRVQYEGKFKDQVVAALHLPGKDKPLYFFLRCVNGLIEPVDTDLKRIGTLNPGSFTIAKGQGLCNHVDYQTSIGLAETFGIPVYKGKIQIEKNRITYKEAMGYENKTDQIAVTVRVYAGDTFDLNAMTYNGKTGK